MVCGGACALGVTVELNGMGSCRCGDVDVEGYRRIDMENRRRDHDSLLLVASG